MKKKLELYDDENYTMEMNISKNVLQPVPILEKVINKSLFITPQDFHIRIQSGLIPNTLRFSCNYNDQRRIKQPLYFNFSTDKMENGESGGTVIVKDAYQTAWFEFNEKLMDCKKIFDTKLHQKTKPIKHIMEKTLE